GAFGDDHKVYDNKNQKQHRSDNVIAADNKLPERLDNRAGRLGSLAAMQQYQTGRSDVQGQPEEGSDQQHGGEHRKIERLYRIETNQQNRQGNRYICGKKNIKYKRRKGNDHQSKDADQTQGNIYVRVFTESAQLYRFY